MPNRRCGRNASSYEGDFLVHKVLLFSLISVYSHMDGQCMDTVIIFQVDWVSKH